MVGQADILQLIVRRMLDKEEPGGFSDGKKIVLAIEGGGLSSAIAAGCASAIQATDRFANLVMECDGDFKAAKQQLEKELNDNCNVEQRQTKPLSCFDAMYGTSAGAPTALYLTTKQGISGTTVYYENLTNTFFLDVKRMFPYVAADILSRGRAHEAKPLMDLDRMIDVINGTLDPEKKLNVALLRQSKTPIRFAVTNLDTMTRELIDPCAGTDEDLYANIKTACLIPGVAGKPITNHPRRVDAMTTPIDLIPPDEADCIVVLSSRPLDSDLRSTRQGMVKIMDDFVSQLSRLAMKDADEAARYLAFDKKRSFSSALHIIKSQKQKDRYVYFGLPKGAAPISNSCMSAEILRNASISGYLNTLEAFRAPLIEELRQRGIAVKNENIAFAPPARWRAAEPENRRFDLRDKLSGLKQRINPARILRR